jgi:sortase A
MTRMVVSLRRKAWNTLSLSLIVLACVIAGALFVANRPEARADMVKVKVPFPLPLLTTTTLPPTTTTTVPPPPPTVPQPSAAPTRDYMDEEVVEIGRLQIPALELDTPLFEGNSLTVIDHGPSHWPGTAMPGHLGNVVVAGHRVTNTRPFRYMDTLQEGDQAILTTVDGVFTYGFAGIEIVTPNRIDIINQTEEYRATFFACHPPGSARYRIVSHWNLLSAPAANSSNVLSEPVNS